MIMDGHSHHNHISHESHGSHKGMIQDFKIRFWVCLILTIPIVLLSPMIREFIPFNQKLFFQGDIKILFLLSSIVYFYGGWPFLKGLYEEINVKQPGMMVLIGLAITVAYIYSTFVVFGLSGKSFFWELATLIDIMLLGHWIEMKSVIGAGHALEELVRLLPSEAHKLMKDGTVQEVPLENLILDDRILIKPGEKVPADGLILEGESYINESLITGESAPIRKEKGTTVIGGAINGDGSIVVQIKKMGKDSFLSQVIEMVKKAQESKSKTQDLANRAAYWLTMIAIACGSLTFFIWIFFAKQDVGFALERMVTVMVITCPHALGLAVPLVIAVSTSIAAKKGLLIRNRSSFETARQIQAVVFDKTGTLTEGKFGVTDVLLLDHDISREELLNYAATLEMLSEHDLAKAIGKSGKKIGDVQGFKAIPGKGAEGKINGKEIKVVSPGFLKEKKMNVENPQILQLNEQGKTVVFVLIDGQIKGAIALADLIRPESKEAIKRLKEMHIKCMMLTGDHLLVGKWVAENIGLDEYFAEVLPNAKADKITEVQKRGLKVAMVGDGVNDAPALAQADLGVAIGAGTDIAIETADIILVKNNPMDFVSILTLSKNTYRKMCENLLWATGYNAIAIPLAAGVLSPFGIVLSPAFGAVLMSVSTIICAINAKLLKIKD